VRKVLMYLILITVLFFAGFSLAYIIEVEVNKSNVRLSDIDFKTYDYLKLPSNMMAAKNDLEFIKLGAGLSLLGLIFVFGSKNNTKNSIKVKNKPHQKNICIDYNDKGGVELMEYESELDKHLPKATYINGVRGKNDSKKGGLIYGSVINKKRGTVEEKIYYEDDNIHNLILGATGTGKTRTILLQSIWHLAQSEESMIISDPKGELFKMSQPGLKAAGYNVILINLDDPYKGNTWDCLETVKKHVANGKITEATDCAINMAKILCSKSLESKGDPIWANASVATITSLIMLTVVEATDPETIHMGTVFELLARKSVKDRKGESELHKYIDNLDINHPAAKSFAIVKASGEKTFPSIIISAISNLQLFNNEKGIRLTKDASFEMANITDEPTAIFLLVPHGSSSFNDLTGLFIEQLYGELISYSTSLGNLLPRRVNFLLDEFGNIPALPDFSKKLTIARGYGIRFTIALQDHQQLKKLYDGDFETILGNMSTLYISVNNDETNQKISKSIGSYTTRSVSVSNSDSSGKSNSQKSKSENYSTQQRPVFYPEELPNIGEGYVLALIARTPPCLLQTPDLSMYRCNHEFFGMVKKTNNLDDDIKKNAKILMEREKLVDSYSYDVSQPLKYWLLEKDNIGEDQDQVQEITDKEAKIDVPVRQRLDKDKGEKQEKSLEETLKDDSVVKSKKILNMKYGLTRTSEIKALERKANMVIEDAKKDGFED